MKSWQNVNRSFSDHSNFVIIIPWMRVHERKHK